jgi:DNA repair protein RadC
MEKLKMNVDKIIDGIHTITGINKDTLKIYSNEFNICDVIDHPMTVGVNDDQYQKLIQLKEFINSYGFLRENESENKVALNSTTLAGKYFVSQLAHQKEYEMVLCAFVNSSFNIISCEKIAQGTVNQSIIYPREVLKRALQLDCTGIILSHNHPGGTLMPSREDKKMTSNFQRIFDPIGIKVYDHFIIAGDQYLSMKDMGLLNENDEAAVAEDYNSIVLEDNDCER